MTTTNFLVKFNSEITGLTKDPFHINHYLSREAINQQARVIEACTAKGEDSSRIFLFMGGENLRYEWSTDLDVGVQTLTVYRIGYTVPVIVLTQSFPWVNQPQHEQMKQSVAYCFSKANANLDLQAAVCVVNMLNNMIIKWMTHDLNNIRESYNPDTFTNFDMEIYRG
jgi:hypothetical protein